MKGNSQCLPFFMRCHAPEFGVTPSYFHHSKLKPRKRPQDLSSPQLPESCHEASGTSYTS
jgi:hypothetical protein